MDVDNIGVAVIIQNTKTKRILLVEEERSNLRTNKKQGELSLVVGHVKKGESLLDAAEREIFEETGLQNVKPNHLIKIYYFKKGHVVFLFSCNTEKVSTKKGKWYLLSEAKEMNKLRSEVYEAILDFEKDRECSLSLIKSD